MHICDSCCGVPDAGPTNYIDLDIDDAPASGDKPKPRRVQLNQIQSLASQTPASGPARIKVLQAAAGQASIADEFRPSLEEEKKAAAAAVESDQVQLLSQQVARLEKRLQEVMTYKELVSTPQRAAATPSAARMAAFAQDFLVVSHNLTFMLYLGCIWLGACPLVRLLRATTNTPVNTWITTQQTCLLESVSTCMPCNQLLVNTC